MSEAYIFDAVRTPRGRGNAKGRLNQIPATALAAHVLRAIVERNDLDEAAVEDVVLGVVSPVAEQGANIGRVAALHAGLGEGVAGVQVNRFCASGLEACNIVAAKAAFGEIGLAIGGGVESMSRVPIFADGGSWMADPAVAFSTWYVPQGVGADAIATIHGFSRTDVDAFAAESQRRAKRAWDEGRFDRSIVPVTHEGFTVLDRDEHMRPESTVESLAKLKAAFADTGARGFNSVIKQRYPEIEQVDHVHHAGNSSGIVDGASAVLIGSREAGDKAGLTPRARIVASATVGTEPAIMLTGPVAVTRKVLAKANMTIDDIDLFEVNEAFASVALFFMREMGIEHERVNVNGGAIAMGHPLGATGAMLIGTALDELERRDLKRAVVTLCVGAGMGIATIIERV